MSWQRILYEKIDSNIVRVTMNRPEAHNAQDFLMREELSEAFTQADLDEDIRVIVFAGAGPSFSSGHDMSGTGMEAKGEEMKTNFTGLERYMKIEEYISFNQGLTMRNVSKPTIAMVQGRCIAGGLLNACMCDIIIAADDATFSNPVARMTFAGSEILVEPWDMGVRKAKEFLFTGDPIDAQEAWRLGLVNKVVPRDRLEEETIRLAKRIALTPPRAISLIKRSLNQTLDFMGQASSWQHHFLICMMSLCTHEQAEFSSAMEEARASGELRQFLKARDEMYR